MALIYNTLSFLMLDGQLLSLISKSSYKFFSCDPSIAIKLVLKLHSSKLLEFLARLAFLKYLIIYWEVFNLILVNFSVDFY